MCPMSSTLSLGGAHVQQSGATNGRVTADLVKGVQGLAVNFPSRIHRYQPANRRVKLGPLPFVARPRLHAHKGRKQHPPRVEVQLLGHPGE